MKLIIMILYLVGNAGLHAQSPKTSILLNGIYLSDSDYLNHTLTKGFEKNRSVKLIDTRRHFISIKTNSITYKFYYDEIWGYKKMELISVSLTKKVSVLIIWVIFWL